MISFNIDDGFLEAVVQGFRDGLLRSYDYNNLIQCDTLEGKYRLLFVTCCGLNSLVEIIVALPFTEWTMCGCMMFLLLLQQKLVLMMMMIH